MTFEEFKEGIIKKGYPKPIIDAAFKHADSMIDTERLVGEDKKHYELVKEIAVVSFIDGFGFCAEGIYPRIKDKL